MPSRIYHVTFASDWAEAQRQGEYRFSTRGARLEDVGFIHASHAHQVRQIGTSHYLDASEPVVVLVIDPTRVPSDVKVENLGGGTEWFPHIYGPLAHRRGRRRHPREHRSAVSSSSMGCPSSTSTRGSRIPRTSPSSSSNGA